MTNKIAVVAAHPDDEILGCGGAMARHVNAGDEVHVLILAEGITSRSPTRDRAQDADGLGDLEKAARAANRLIGVASLTLRDFPDNRMDGVDRLDVIKAVESFFAAIRPQVVYTHHASDVNIDHRRIHEAVVTASRPVPGHFVRSLLFFEVPSSTEWQTPGSAHPFSPNWFVDVSSTLARKTEALRLYDSEMRTWPHARSVEAVEYLARWRGATVGVDAAEAFVLGRNIR